MFRKGNMRCNTKSGLQDLQDHATLRRLSFIESISGGDTLLRGLFRTKNLDEILSAAGGPQFSLKRTLNAFNVTLIGIGAIIGAGIFATVGTAASGTAERAGAGPSLMRSEERRVGKEWRAGGGTETGV